MKIRMLDAEIGRFAVPVWGELEDELQPKERLYSRSIMGLFMSFISITSDRKTLCLMNRVLHRSIDDGEDEAMLRLRTMTDLCERTGRQISACSKALGAHALSEHGFSPETGLPLSETRLSPGITHPDADMLPIRDVMDAAKRLQEKGTWIKPQVFGDQYEDPAMSCYVAIDDIGVKKQKEHRKGSTGVSKKRETVENTVAKVMSEEEEHILTGIGMENLFQTLLGFLLHNQLLTHQSLIFLTDGAKNIRNNIKSFFAFRPWSIILDWYHLEKKCGEYLSMGVMGSKIRNQVWDVLKQFLWGGDVDAAQSYVRGLDAAIIKDKEWLDKLNGYFEKNREFIPCYAVRAALGLRNSSSPVEKANDMIVADRQKHNGMSWSPDGSGALASIRAVVENGELSYWLQHRTLPFTMHIHTPWARFQHNALVRAA